MIFVIASLAVITSAETIEVYLSRAHEVEQQKQAAQLEAKKQAESRRAAQEAENAFKNMSPAQHFSAAQNDLHVGASEGLIADGMNQLDALKGTPMEGRAKALLDRYQAEKAKAGTVAAAKAAAAAARQEKENAEALETARITFARTVEDQMLDQGFDFDVTAVGARHTILRMKWALASKAVAYQISERAQMLETARELGFKRMELTDGYDHAWSWDLQ
jgi:hypothetical protein